TFERPMRAREGVASKRPSGRASLVQAKPSSMPIGDTFGTVVSMLIILCPPEAVSMQSLVTFYPITRRRLANVTPGSTGQEPSERAVATAVFALLGEAGHATERSPPDSHGASPSPIREASGFACMPPC